MVDGQETSNRHDDMVDMEEYESTMGSVNPTDSGITPQSSKRARRRTSEIEVNVWEEEHSSPGFALVSSDNSFIAHSIHLNI